MSRESTGPGGAAMGGSADLSGYVPITRTVNGLPLSTNIVIPAPDLSGYVPIARTVNGHALSGNVAVTLEDLGLVAKQTGDLLSPNTIFQVTGMDCNNSDFAGFEIVFVAKVDTAGQMRLQVNGSNFDPFLNGADVDVWGTSSNNTYSGINVLAGDHTTYPPQMDFAVDDVVHVRVRCDIAKQEFGFGRRVINVNTKHVSAGATAPVVQSEANFVLDEGYAAGQNIGSVGIQMDGGLWAAGAHYILSRLPL